MIDLAQSVDQRDRCRELYSIACCALESLAEERLNLGGATRAALDRARQNLEEFDYARLQQPVTRRGGGAL